MYMAKCVSLWRFIASMNGILEKGMISVDV